MQSNCVSHACRLDGAGLIGPFNCNTICAEVEVCCGMWCFVGPNMARARTIGRADIAVPNHLAGGAVTEEEAPDVRAVAESHNSHPHHPPAAEPAARFCQFLPSLQHLRMAICLLYRPPWSTTCTVKHMSRHRNSLSHVSPESSSLPTFQSRSSVRGRSDLRFSNSIARDMSESPLTTSIRAWLVSAGSPSAGCFISSTLPSHTRQIHTFESSEHAAELRLHITWRCTA